MTALWIMRSPQGQTEYEIYDYRMVTHDENHNRDQRKDP